MSTTLEQRLRYIKQEKNTKIIPNNIRSGVTILNITGNLIESNEEANVTIDPSTQVVNIVPGYGYTGIASVTVNAVTANIDNNIISDNIKNGVTILNITGKSSVVDTYDADAIEREICANKMVYVNGQKITGTAEEITIPGTSRTDLMPRADKDRNGNDLAESSALRNIVVNNNEIGFVTPTLSNNPNIQTTALWIKKPYLTIATKQSILAKKLNLTADKLLSGNTILGVTGNVIGLNAHAKSVTPTTNQQIIEPDSPYNALSSVTVNAVTSDIDSNITSANIRSGVTILGVQGNLSPGKPGQTKTVTPTTNQQTVQPDTGYELTSVTVEAIETEQKIVKSTTSSQTITPTSGKFIDEITVSPIVLENITITPSTTNQTITPSSNKDGINEITVSAVTSNIDNNIIPGNIKNGVTILGVTGDVIAVNNETSQTVTPTTSQQIIQPASGYTGLAEVVVDAIATETKTVKSTTSSQTITPTSGHFINEITVTPIDLEVINITPTTNTQTITPSSGNDGISQINVSAVTSAIDSNITASNILNGVNILGVTGNVNFESFQDYTDCLNTANTILGIS